MEEGGRVSSWHAYAKRRERERALDQGEKEEEEGRRKKSLRRRSRSIMVAKPLGGRKEGRKKFKKLKY